jgi:hypothetical protein
MSQQNYYFMTLSDGTLNYRTYTYLSQVLTSLNTTNVTSSGSTTVINTYDSSSGSATQTSTTNVYKVSGVYTTWSITTSSSTGYVLSELVSVYNSNNSALLSIVMSFGAMATLLLAFF